MLLVGWNSLDKEAQDYVFNIVRCLARGESVLEVTRHTINIHASAGQVNAGNGNIENLNMVTRFYWVKLLFLRKST